MKLQELQANWDCLAQIDPFWAILFDPAKRNKNWKEDEFFKSGEEEIERVLAYLNTLNISVRIINISDHTWPAGDAHQIGLGNHWLESHVRLIVQDDGRTSLPKRLGPTEEVELPLTVLHQ